MFSFTCVHFKRPVGGHSPRKEALTHRAAVADAAFSLSPGESSADWAKNLNREDFRLLCLDGTTKPVTEAQSCYLAVAPNHAVVSRSDRAAHVEQVLLHQQVRITGPPACAYLQGLPSGGQPQSSADPLISSHSSSCPSLRLEMAVVVHTVGLPRVSGPWTCAHCPARRGCLSLSLLLFFQQMREATEPSFHSQVESWVSSADVSRAWAGWAMFSDKVPAFVISKNS